LKTPADFRRLALDSLCGRNTIRPAGREVQSGVWFGEGARVDKSVCIQPPAYIGAHTRIKGSCLIAHASSIERQCEIDCGTTVDDSSIFPGTYLGIGLNIRRSLVGGRKLFHLDRNVQVEIRDRSLISIDSKFALKRYLGAKTKPLALHNTPLFGETSCQPIPRGWHL
jgi:NDP-sugar pyrophosphorylase family protein